MEAVEVVPGAIEASFSSSLSFQRHLLLENNSSINFVNYNRGIKDEKNGVTGLKA